MSHPPAHNLFAVGTVLSAIMIGGCSSQPKSYDCAHAATSINIDGRIDDEAWNAAEWTPLFIDIEGTEKPQPRFATRAKMLWDNEYFYVAAHLEEPHVWGTLTEHDQIVFHDNDFEIFIDPDGDRCQYYEIEINVLETIFDLRLVSPYYMGGPAHHSWDATGMLSAVHIDGTLNDASDIDRSWSVEFAIPFTLLAEYTGAASPPDHGDTWRVNFSRVQWQHVIENGAYQKVPKTPEDNWVWSPQHKINMHLPRHWGLVTFVD